jgi:hypothetical protein
MIGAADRVLHMARATQELVGTVLADIEEAFDLPISSTYHIYRLPGDLSGEEIADFGNL